MQIFEILIIKNVPEMFEILVGIHLYRIMLSWSVKIRAGRASKNNFPWPYWYVVCVPTEKKCTRMQTIKDNKCFLWQFVIQNLNPIFYFIGRYCISQKRLFPYVISYSQLVCYYPRLYQKNCIFEIVFFFFFFSY